MAMAKGYVTETLLDTAVVTLTAGAIAGAVGYREQSGKPEEELMPHIGPVPLDLGVGVAGHVIGFALSATKYPRVGRIFNKIGDGGFAVFGVSAGQSAGASLYDSMKKNSSGGGARAPRQMPQGMPTPAASEPAKEYRAADGRHVQQPQWARQAA